LAAAFMSFFLMGVLLFLGLPFFFFSVFFFSVFFLAWEGPASSVAVFSYIAIRQHLYIV
jgi:hypothetical protein